MIAVKVVGDVVFEANEIFFVNLSAVVHGSIGKGQGIGTIVNDDGMPSLSINDSSVFEGNSGTVDASFTVTLAGASSQGITVNFATADGTATSPSDYLANSGTLTFAPGEASKKIVVKVNGDTVYESDETFFVNLTNPVNATISKAQGLGTILNDDNLPTLSINE